MEIHVFLYSIFVYIIFILYLYKLYLFYICIYYIYSSSCIYQICMLKFSQLKLARTYFTLNPSWLILFIWCFFEYKIIVKVDINGGGGVGKCSEINKWGVKINRGWQIEQMDFSMNNFRSCLHTLSVYSINSTSFLILFFRLLSAF